MTEDLSHYNSEGTKLRKAQLRMLEILVEVDAICTRHNIPYWLAYGSCLGAVRHGGFIPWDDDLDIALMKSDYKKLMLLLQKELPQHLVAQDPKLTKRFHYNYGKVRDRNSRVKTNLWSIEEVGISIDIFPMQQTFSKKGKHFVDYFYRRSYKRVRRQTDSKLQYAIGLICFPFAYLLKSFYCFFSAILPKKYLVPICGAPCDYYTKIEDTIPVKPIVFEQHTFQGPANPDAYLKSIYGDYMKIPPKDKRLVHAIEDFIFYDSKTF